MEVIRMFEGRFLRNDKKMNTKKYDMKDVSKYITYNEATMSWTGVKLGIVNVPNTRQLAAMEYVAVEVFDKVREYAKVPLRVNSFFRCKELNTAVKGAKSSLHLLGAAIDIDSLSGRVDNDIIFHYIRYNLPFTELIWEYGNDENPNWVHVGLVKGRENERVVKRCRLVNGDPKYTVISRG